ncbi:MAG: hypothetical protein J6Y19_07995, partial [Kiritimatiellae bacterium]|nr:hypothetical protein [Kiritimatiellia bacterium]
AEVTDAVSTTGATNKSANRVAELAGICSPQLPVFCSEPMVSCGSMTAKGPPVKAVWSQSRNVESACGAPSAPVWFCTTSTARVVRLSGFVADRTSIPATDVAGGPSVTDVGAT